MLTRWLTLTAFLAVSADLVSETFSSGTMTVAPTCRVKGRLEEDLTLSCGDQRKAGIIQFWHTPFGDLESPGFQNSQDPVFMHPDGSLVVSNMSRVHSGLYYCLLEHEEGSTLWSYELHVGQKSQTDDGGGDQHHCGALRIRRDVRSAGERQGGASDEECAGAVAASVILTFVLGFSAGALSRSRVLRCLGTFTTKLRSAKQKQQSDTVDHGSRVNTLPPMYDNQALEMESVAREEDSTSLGQDLTVSSTASSPPAKPKRSFSRSREEVRVTTTYLERCDRENEEEEEEEEEQQRGQEERHEGCDEEAERERESSSTFYISDRDGSQESQTETEEDECRADQEHREETESSEKEKREDSESESSSSSGDEKDGRVTDHEGDEERREGEEVFREERVEDDGANKQEEDSDDEKHYGEVENGASVSPPSHGRRSRVIRLYQYDEDGQRYGHLPNPSPNEPVPAPRLKQRSRSLTRLNAIMAAASAGPLDSRDGEKTEKEERAHFQMEI